MKSFLLCAGKGTRLAPITLDTPKCLVAINGKPLIEYWFDLFKRYSIDEILINVHHLPQKIIEYVTNTNNGIKIKLVYEQQLLGSAGTIVENEDFIRNEDNFWVFYADVLTNIRLDEMYSFHSGTNADITIAVHKTLTPRSCGIADMDASGKINSFIEKPLYPANDLANSGIYLLKSKVIKSFPDTVPLDFGRDVLVRKDIDIYGFRLLGYIRDIGTPESYLAANEDVQKGVYVL